MKPLGQNAAAAAVDAFSAPEVIASAIAVVAFLWLVAQSAAPLVAVIVHFACKDFTASFASPRHSSHPLSNVQECSNYITKLHFSQAKAR